MSKKQKNDPSFSSGAKTGLERQEEFKHSKSEINYMATLNRWQGIGRLGKDPEVRSLDNGNTVANFSLACTESYKDKATGQKKEVTEWVNCVAWKALADITSKFLHKGDLVFVEGKLRTRSYGMGV